MNLILFEEDEIDQPLQASDIRYKHITSILKSKPGDKLKAGIISKSLGYLEIEDMSDKIISFKYAAETVPTDDRLPLTLIIGTPRPPTAKRLLKDLTTIGVKRLIFCGSDLNEKSYLSSKLWRDELWKEAVIEGAQQAVTIHFPIVEKFYSLKKAIDSCYTIDSKFFFNIDDQNIKLSQVKFKKEIVIALGPERGWSEREINMLIAENYTPVYLGNRVLRTETAAVISTSHFF